MGAAAAGQARMPLGAHLREARNRAFRAAVALVVGMGVGYVLADPILDVLREPILDLAESRAAVLNYDTVTGAFDLRLTIAMFAGIILSSPVWLYQAFAFLVPGMTRRERRYTFGFVAAALPLFVAGCLVGFAIFPHMIELLTSFAAEEDSTILQASYYVDFVTKMVVAVGFVFVLPVLVVMLNLLGVLPAHAIRRGWRLAVVGIAVFSALVTPAADVLSMVIVAGSMTGLFFAAYAVAVVHDRRAARRLEAELDGVGVGPPEPGTPAAGSRAAVTEAAPTTREEG
ncbi:twin-arginine translocase subunit TatC [Demequina pelophila]|uniref:twin-arginine translocase subunit TatC n=1 Tax=Demequina pelophila TaxID=1638984 RepID=UPI000ACDCDFE|nr:twin-arginine translocase subunit TatC [Demequina pelophila]